MICLKPLFKNLLAKQYHRFQYHFSIVDLRNEYISGLEIEPEDDFFLCTKGGLYRIRDKELFLLIKGEFYGLTYLDDIVYAFQKIANHGRLIRFIRNVDDEGFKNFEVFMDGLSPGCHQIDIYKGSLFVCDTYNNAIIEIDLNTDEIINEYFPLGRLTNGRRSANYGHINSLYFDNSSTYAVCHNHTVSTGRTSQVLLLGEKFTIEECITTSCNSAHNIMPWKGSFLICDSMNGTLKLGDEVVFEAGCFTRGLSVTEDYILLGGSQYAKRDVREYASGELFVIDKEDFGLINQFKLPSMINEIRRMNLPDMAMSDNMQRASIIKHRMENHIHGLEVPD